MNSFKLKNVAISLVGINIVVFVLQMLFSGINGLSLVPSEILSKPYLLLTHMFLHGSFSHLLFNMYALFIFGPLIEQRIGSKRFFYGYFAAGFFAAFAFIVANLNSNIAAVGASGAIMGVLGLVIMLLPDLRVLFFFVIPMKMRTAGIIFALVDLVGLFGPSDGIAHIAHLGGLAFGLAYGYYLKKKKNEFIKSFTAPRMHVYTTPEKKPTRKPYEKTIELSKDDLDGYFKYGKL